MKRSCVILTFLAAFVTFCAHPQTAEAVRVKNLDTRPHQLSIATTRSASDARVVELAPGEVFTTYSPYVTLRLLDGSSRAEQYARYRDEYIIWPGGLLALQKRRWPRHEAF